MHIVKTDERSLKLRQLEKMLFESGNGKQAEKSAGSLYIWGCSETARMITEFCSNNSRLEITAYIVDDVYYKERVFLNKPVLKASEWRKNAGAGDCVIFGFTGLKRAEELAKNLPDPNRGFYFSFPYSANVDGTYLTYDDYCKEKLRFERAYECLADEISRKVMEAFINGCISREIGELEKLRSDGQYFNELTEHMKKGCFVDLGAYTGDTIEKAADFYGENLERIVALEPDENNIKQLEERVKSCGIPPEKLLLVQKGSWSGKDVLHFSSSNSSSSISDAGDIVIEVDSVDHVLKECEFPVSFIKMDVEGSEGESLLGAADTIRKWHPILAICVYHKPDDLYLLTGQIRELLKEAEYRFYLRYYGPDLRELVFYAIPQ